MKRIYTLFLLVSLSILFTNHSQAQTYCTAGNQYGNLMGILNFQFNTINNASASSATGYEDFTNLNTQIVPGVSYNMTVTTTASYGEYCQAWIDYDHNYDFNGSNEQLFASAFGSTNPGTYTSPNFTVPTNLTHYGATRLRVRSMYYYYYIYGYNTMQPCNNFYYGEAEDYTVTVVAMTNMRFDSTYAVQSSTASVFQGQNFAKILDVNVKTYGFLNRQITKKVCFSTTGTTSTGDILKARLFKADKSPLDLNDAIGNPVINPNGSFYFTVHDTLLPDQHYILTYDVNLNATPGNKLDATFDSIVISDTLRNPKVSNPAGNRTIVQYFSYTGYCTMGVTYPNSYSSTLIGVTKFYMTDPSGSVLFNNVTADLDATTTYPTPNPTVYRQSKDRKSVV